MPLRNLAPYPFLRVMVVGDGKGHDMLQAHLTFAVGGEKGRGDIRQLQPLLHHGFGDAEARGHIGERRSLVDERLEGLELVGGMHRLALHVFRKADFSGIRVLIDDVAGNGPVRPRVSGLGQRLKREQPPASGHHGVFAALVLAHDQRLQQPMRRNRCGQFLDAFAAIGFADIAFPCEQFVQRDGDCIAHDPSPWLGC